MLAVTISVILYGLIFVCFSGILTILPAELSANQIPEEFTWLF